MAKSQFKKNYLDYYTVNEDYSGERHTNNKEEAVLSGYGIMNRP